MNLDLCRIGLCWALCGAIAFAQGPTHPTKSLAEAAAERVVDLPRGCIVTGESVDGVVAFAGAGELPDGSEGSPGDLLFEIGSITKVFNGLLLAQMVVADEVTLEDTVTNLLDPGVTFADERVGAITLLQLVTHTSGLRRLPEDLFQGAEKDDPYAHYDESRMIGYLAKAKLEGEPPFDLSYSNLGAGLLGHLLARKAGQPWEELVRERICKPLGLEDTQVDVSASPRVFAPPYSGKKESHTWSLAALKSAGSLRSTAADLIRFGQAFLDPDSTPLAKAIRLASQPHAGAPSSGGQIGLGIFIGKRDGHTVLNHSGGTGGYRTFIQIEPDAQRVSVVLVNNSEFEPATVLAAQRPKAKKSAKERVEVALEPDELKRFPGVYALDGSARFTVLQREGGLWIRLTGQTFLKAFPMGKDRFFLKVVEAEFQFDSGEGPAGTLTLFQNGNELLAKRSDDPLPVVKFRPPAELKPYTGDYTMIGGAKFEITLRGATLFAKLADQPALPVFEIAEDTFEYDVVEAKLTFTRNDDRTVNGLVLRQNGMTLPAAREKE